VSIIELASRHMAWWAMGSYQYTELIQNT